MGRVTSAHSLNASQYLIAFVLFSERISVPNSFCAIKLEFSRGSSSIIPGLGLGNLF